jgi:chemotaxis protein CheX
MAGKKPARIRLPEGLDTGAAAALASELAQVRGRPLRLDASSVERVGGLGLQVLLSARLTWRDDGAPMALEAPSDALRAAFAQAGAAFDFDRSS